MTDVATTTSTDVAVPSTGVVGMEDIGAGDLSVPRLTLDHKRGVIADTQTAEEFSELECILLGVVKQRVLWQAGDDFSQSPLCKSFDFAIGFPGDEFPWEASGFNKADFAGQEQPKLDCGSCQLKEWDTHPKRDRIPWCTEQWVFPLVVPLGDEGEGAPALITFQRSQLTNTKAYVSGFARIQKPLFTALTKITLEKYSRGQVDYVVPKFQKLAETPEHLHDLFTEQYLGIRGFLVTPRIRKDDVAGAGASSATTESTSKTPAPAAVAEDGGEIPF